MSDTFDSLVAILTQLAAPALFEMVEGGDRGKVWFSPYARLLLWPVAAGGDAVTLRMAATEGQDHLDGLLREAASPASAVVDGYLVLALDGAVATENQELRQAIRELELNTVVCRKTVIWPEGPDWPRLYAVPVLASKTINRLDEAAGWPEFSAEESGMWEELTQLGGAVVGKNDKEVVEPAR